MGPGVLSRALRAFAGLLVWSSSLAIPAATLAADGGELLSQARAQREAGDLPAAALSLERLLSSALDGYPGGAALPVLHRELGEVYAAMQRPGDAAAEFERSLAADPVQTVLRYQTGILYRQLGRHSKAAEHLSEAFQQGFRNTAVRFHLAASQFATGKFAAGLGHARMILQPSPPASDSALRVGKLLFEYHFYRDAIVALESALDGASQPMEARVYLALSNHLLNRHERTVELLQPLVARDGSANAEVLTLLAAALASLDRFEEAEALFGQASAKEPSSPHPYLNHALVLLEQGKAERASESFDRMFGSAGSESPKVFYAIRRNSCHDAYHETAGRSRSGDVGANPDRGLQFFEFARSLSRRHHHGTAVELLRVAAGDTGDRDLPRARLYRALGLSCLNLASGNETPTRLLERATELDPLDHRAHFLLGRAFQERHRPEQAAKAFQRAIELQPDASAYYTELARSLMSGGGGVDQSERAVSILVKAIQIDSSDPAARFELGKLRMGQGRLDEAEQHLRKALEAAPEFYEAHYVLGQVYARAKKTAQARDAIRAFEATKSAIEARSTVWKDSTVGIAAE